MGQALGSPRRLKSERKALQGLVFCGVCCENDRQQMVASSSRASGGRLLLPQGALSLLQPMARPPAPPPPEISQNITSAALGSREVRLWVSMFYPICKPS